MMESVMTAEHSIRLEKRKGIQIVFRLVLLVGPLLWKEIKKLCELSFLQWHISDIHKGSLLGSI